MPVNGVYDPAAHEMQADSDLGAQLVTVGVGRLTASEVQSALLQGAASANAYRAAGLIDYCRKGHFKKGQRVVFLHTGGSVALFGYDALFSDPA